MRIDEDAGVERDDAVQTDDEEMARGNIHGDDDPLQRESFHESIPSMKKCSFTKELVNGIKALSGIGLLTTPYAVKGGWMSFTLLIIFGVVACYTMILLKRCLESSPDLQTYPDIGLAAFGAAGRFIIAAACVEYVIIMSDNLSTIFPNTSIHISEIYLNAHQIFAIIGILIVLPTDWLRDLIGVGASILVVLCLLSVEAVDQSGFIELELLSLANVPISVGIYSFCYAGHTVCEVKSSSCSITLCVDRRWLQFHRVQHSPDRVCHELRPRRKPVVFLAAHFHHSTPFTLKYSKKLFTSFNPGGFVPDSDLVVDKEEFFPALSLALRSKHGKRTNYIEIIRQDNEKQIPSELLDG
ncbi:Eukaryotic aspartyl protease family protein [Hibiscus syriacus]|uniref:Eukaryotic aspartyl protease family protein n=1 Tax=Hibiscus syriacus TaxID=106335 RepID=A0A6A3AT16_HIBSY|nr:Eukaryotic aspartyl protease family protein [Hibiscus syriacus]